MSRYPSRPTIVQVGFSWPDPEGGLWSLVDFQRTPVSRRDPSLPALMQVEVVCENPDGDHVLLRVEDFACVLQEAYAAPADPSRSRTFTDELLDALPPERLVYYQRLAKLIIDFEGGVTVAGCKLPVKGAGRAGARREFARVLSSLGFTAVSPVSLARHAKALRDTGGDLTCLLTTKERQPPAATSPLSKAPTELVDAARRFVARVEVGNTPALKSLRRDFDIYLREETSLEPRAYSDRMREAVVRELCRGNRTGSPHQSVRNKTGRPKGRQGRWIASRPYESLQIDAWTVDCQVYDQYGKLIRILMLAAVDTVTAEVRALRFVTSATMEAVRLLIADTVRGGPAWPNRVPACPALPEFVEFGGRLEEALGGAGIYTEPTVGTLHVDLGSGMVGGATLADATSRNIHVQPARPARGSDKPHVESFFSSVAEFVRRLPGATGSDSTQRGAPPARYLHVPHVEAFILMWAEYGYHRHPQRGLAPRDMPGVDVSPHDMGVLLITTAKALHVERDALADWALRPKAPQGHVVNDEGVRLQNRDYDSDDTVALKRATQGDRKHKQRKLPLRYDPNDTDFVMIRDVDGDLLVLPDRDLDAPVRPLQSSVDRELRALLATAKTARRPDYAAVVDVIVAAARRLAGDAAPPAQSEPKPPSVDEWADLDLELA